jgi:hypothetical protein
MATIEIHGDPFFDDVSTSLFCGARFWHLEPNDIIKRFTQVRKFDLSRNDRRSEKMGVSPPVSAPPSASAIKVELITPLDVNFFHRFAIIIVP